MVGVAQAGLKIGRQEAVNVSLIVLHLGGYKYLGE